MKDLAFSIGGNGSATYTIQLPGGLGNVGTAMLPKLIQQAITLLLVVAIVLSFVFVLIGGFKWILSQGDKKQVEEAQKTITYAIIGLVIALLSFFILNLIGFAFGVTLLPK